MPAKHIFQKEEKTCSYIPKKHGHQYRTQVWYDKDTGTGHDNFLRWGHGNMILGYVHK